MSSLTAGHQKPFRFYGHGFSLRNGLRFDLSAHVLIQGHEATAGDSGTWMGTSLVQGLCQSHNLAQVLTRHHTEG